MWGGLVFKKSVKLKGEYLDALEKTLEDELRYELHQILEPHLKNRRVFFQDAMGSATVAIECRDGGQYIISGDDMWKSPKGASVSGFTFVDFNTAPFLREVKNIIIEYNDIIDNQIALEFTFSVGDAPAKKRKLKP